MKEKMDLVTDQTEDTNSARDLKGIGLILITATAFLYAIFQIYTAGTGSLPNIIQRSLHVLLAVILIFGMYRFSKKNSKSNIIPWYDLILIILTISGLLYLILNYNFIMANPASSTTVGVILGWITIILLLEAARRIMGIVFPLIALIAILYGFLGPYLPEVFAHNGIDYKFMVEHLYLSTYGIWGVTTSVTATTVAVFIIFGTILMRTGGGNFYIKLALLLAGKMSGGPAKVAVLASSFFGMLSGSAPGNVAVTGNITIPTMIRLKYDRNFAGAVESVASTGGQLAPPIMGAGAFLMAEILGISYFNVVIAAILPAALYYFSVFYSVHVYSVKSGLKGMRKEDIPTFKETITFNNVIVSVLPVLILLFFLFSGSSPSKAGFLAVLTSLLIYILKALISNERIDQFKKLISLISDAGKDLIMIAVLAGVADIVVGMLSLTGLGNKLSNVIVNLGANIGWSSVPLILTMVVALILGMGMPTTAAYILSASTLAPTLIALGFHDLASHLFIFYFAVISAITPPVCAAVYVACGISKGNWVKTAFKACQLGFPAFILPFVFIYSENLLLKGDFFPTLLAIGTFVIGIIGLSAGLLGYFQGEISFITKLILIVSGLLLCTNGIYYNLFGLVIIIVLYILKKGFIGKSKALNV